MSAKEIVRKLKRAENKPFDYKTTIWVGLLLVALIIVVMLILMFNQNEKIDSSYFHNDDGKIVLTMDRNISMLDDSPWESGIVHVVYYHDGPKITNMRVFYEYTSEEMARIAMLKLAPGEYAESKKISGRFLIFQIKKSQYENTTIDDLESTIENLEELDVLIPDYNEDTVFNYAVSFPDGNEEIEEEVEDDFEDEEDDSDDDE